MMFILNLERSCIGRFSFVLGIASFVIVSVSSFYVRRRVFFSHFQSIASGPSKRTNENSRISVFRTVCRGNLLSENTQSHSNMYFVHLFIQKQLLMSIFAVLGFIPDFVIAWCGSSATVAFESDAVL